jgi:3-oxoadipate enol-lactonase
VRRPDSLLIYAPSHKPDYRLPVPTLLVHGQLDQIGDIAASTREWARREPLAEHAVIPAAGHASNLDNPAAFTAALIVSLHRVLAPAAVAEPPSPEERAEEPHQRHRPERDSG